MARQSGLVSLRMLMNYAQAFAMLAADIEKIRAQLIIYAVENKKDVLDPQGAKMVEFRERISTLLATCQQVNQLDRMSPPLGRMLARIDAGMGALEMHHAIDALQFQLFDELDRIRLFHVEEGLVSIYENPAPFGSNVFDRLSSANVDAVNAGKCLALGQPTACVFHLMRVMEVGLRCLSADLGIKYAPSWEAHLSKIRKILEAPYSDKTRIQKNKESFYKEVMADLETVKLLWRNPTMHIEKDFDIGQAKLIYVSVGTFMKHLADKLKEPSRPAPPAVFGVLEKP